MFPKKKGTSQKHIGITQFSAWEQKLFFDHVKRCLSLPAQCAHKMKRFSAAKIAFQL
jgi:hypothetical protein